MNNRNPQLLKLARDKKCLLLAVENCQHHNTVTTVAAHSNQQKHGKGMGIKAHDYYSVWACVNCHSWLDQGKAPKAEKQRAFDEAHKRQIFEWRMIWEERKEGMKDLLAAHWALEKLNCF